jgi:hypothetical protein
MAKTKTIVGAIVGGLVGAAAIAASVFTLVKSGKNEDVDALPEGDVYETDDYEEVVDDVEDAE